MNIDAEIRDILSRSFPVNDNNKPDSHGCNLDKTQSNSGIYVIGNHNIIVHTSFLMLATIMFCFGVIILMQH